MGSGWKLPYAHLEELGLWGLGLRFGLKALVWV